MDKADIFLNIGVILMGAIAMFYCVLYWKLRRKKEKDDNQYCYRIQCPICRKSIVVSESEIERIWLMRSDFFVVFNGDICCKSCFHDVLILDKEKRNAYLDSLKDF